MARSNIDTRKISNKKQKTCTVPESKTLVRTIEYNPPKNDPRYNNLSIIQGYTGHWKDPVYIAMMHTRISDKLEIFLEDLGVVLAEIEESQECEEDQTFIVKVKNLVLVPLRKALNRITEYDDYVLHALSKEATGVVLDIAKNTNALDIVIFLCKTETYAGTFTYYYEDNRIEYNLFFDDERYYFLLNQNETDE